jgi:hypothetical protein
MKNFGRFTLNLESSHLEEDEQVFKEQLESIVDSI